MEQQGTMEGPNQSLDAYAKERVEYIPPANEVRRRHDIRIEFLDKGCVVRVGCKSIAFNDYEEAMKELNAYVKDPIAAYKKWGKELGAEL